MARLKSSRATAALLSVGIGILVVVCAVTAAGPLADAGAAVASANESAQASDVSEKRYVEAAPEPGEEYFEAEASDGSWISYDNPRDRYRDPYVGEASGKICVTLRNEAGEVVVGESVPNTTVTIPNNGTLAWHSYADPMTVQFPLTRHYDRPLDSDQFGISPDLPQGDGFMDSHCIEFHGPPENATIEYGEPEIEGEHADRIEVVGYVQQANRAWETDVDPIADAVSYEEAGGGWTNRPNASHGQVTITLQLRPAGTNETATPTPTPSPTPTATVTPTETETAGAESTDLERAAEGEEATSLDQTAPGAVVVAFAVALSTAVLARRRR